MRCGLDSLFSLQYVDHDVLPVPAIQHGVLGFYILFMYMGSFDYDLLNESAQNKVDLPWPLLEVKESMLLEVLVASLHCAKLATVITKKVASCYSLL